MKFEENFSSMAENKSRDFDENAAFWIQHLTESGASQML